MNALQGSDAWRVARAGHATCSRFKDLLARVKVGESASRRNYRVALVAERLTGVPIEGYQNAAMAHGTATEPIARMSYEAHTGELVDEVGFLTHPTIKWCGGSADGLVGDDGLIEIKSPFVPTVHLETLTNGMPSDHMAQCQGLMFVLGRQWTDFVSFDCRFPAHLQLYVQRIERDDAYIQNLETEVCGFLSNVDTLYHQLMARSPLVQAIDPTSAACQP